MSLLFVIIVSLSLCTACVGIAVSKVKAQTRYPKDSIVPLVLALIGILGSWFLIVPYVYLVTQHY